MPSLRSTLYFRYAVDKKASFFYSEPKTSWLLHMKTLNMESNQSEQNLPVVLVADDDEHIRILLDYNLRKTGFKTLLARDGDEAISLLSDDILVVLLDLQMPGKSGMECLRHIKAACQDTQVIIITASSKVSDAVEALKAGAFDYLTKPLEIEAVIALLCQAVRVSQLSTENRQLRQIIGDFRPQTTFIGKSLPIQTLLAQAEKVSQLDATVLITGESGVGKGLLARFIHYSGPRADKPFVTVSCTSLPRELVETELFGHEKGAFTGAQQRRIGLIEFAGGGTVFLDEIGDMPLELQPKLLNFLQERCFHRIGGNKPINSDVRIIAATHQDLKELVKKNSFREDLYFRINVVPLNIPPLRERGEDILVLAGHFLGRIAQKRGDAPLTLADDALRILSRYDWPGNVRELENVLERATIFCSGPVISAGDLPPELQKPAVEQPLVQSLADLTLDTIEKMAIEQTLASCNGNKALAAIRLGISEKSIYNKVKRFGLQ